MRKCLIDAGPMIALFDRHDNFHKPVHEFIRGFKGRLYTSWAAVTEVLHMLDFDTRAQIDFLTWIQRDALEIPILDKTHLSRIIELSSKYSDIPMDFADATLLVLSETEAIKEIITIDSDFHVYRNIRKEMLRDILNEA